MTMEAGGAKGTVTSLSSLFPAEDAHKAAARVQDTLSEKQKELDCLRGFISDNANLINLVQKLPEELYHEVMVPLLLPLYWVLSVFTVICAPIFMFD